MLLSGQWQRRWRATAAAEQGGGQEEATERGVAYEDRRVRAAAAEMRSNASHYHSFHRGKRDALTQRAGTERATR